MSYSYCYGPAYDPDYGRYYGASGDPRSPDYTDEVDAIVSLTSNEGMDPIEALEHIDRDHPDYLRILDLCIDSFIGNGDLPKGFTFAQ